MVSKLNEFQHYLQNEKGYSQGTIEAYQLDIEKGLIPFLQQRGKFALGEVTKTDIRAYLDYLATDKDNSSATRAWKLVAIKSFFNYLVENEDLEVSPAASIRSPRIPEKEPVYLTDEESIRVLTTIIREASPQARERDLAMVVLFLHTGLRVSELAKLELVNVDLGRGQIKITRKGNKEQYLHLNGGTVRVLANYVANRPQARNGRLFVGTNGGKPNRGYVYGIVRRYLTLTDWSLVQPSLITFRGAKPLLPQENHCPFKEKVSNHSKVWEGGWILILGLMRHISLAPPTLRQSFACLPGSDGLFARTA